MSYACGWGPCPNPAHVLVRTKRLVTAEDGVQVRAQTNVTGVCLFHIGPVVASGYPFSTALRPILPGD